MARIAIFLGGLVGLGRFTEAIPLPDEMDQSLARIAAQRSISKPEPLDDLHHGLDRMRKEVLAECQNESDSFNEWLQARQDDLNNNTEQIKRLALHEREMEAAIVQLNETHSRIEKKRINERAELEKAEKDLISSCEIFLNEGLNFTTK